MPDVAEMPRPFSCSRTFIVDRGVDCLLLRSFEKCLTAFAGPCSAVYFPICALTSDVYSLYLPRPLLSPSNACFTSALVLSSSFSEREGTFAGSVGTLLKYLTLWLPRAPNGALKMPGLISHVVPRSTQQPQRSYPVYFAHVLTSVLIYIL